MKTIFSISAVLIWVLGSLNGGSLPNAFVAPGKVYDEGEWANLASGSIQLLIASSTVRNPNSTQRETLYQGPVSVTITYCMLLHDPPSPDGPQMTTITDGVAQVAPIPNGYTVRCFISIHWPGAEQADARLEAIRKAGNHPAILLAESVFSDP